MAERKPATASCVATFRKNGDVYAISHAHKATGLSCLLYLMSLHSCISFRGSCAPRVLLFLPKVTKHSPAVQISTAPPPTRTVTVMLRVWGVPPSHWYHTTQTRPATAYLYSSQVLHLPPVGGARHNPPFSLHYVEPLIFGDLLWMQQTAPLSSLSRTGDAGAKRNGTGAKKDNPISGGTRDSAARFVTTNQRTFVQHKGTPIGYSNQGPDHSLPSLVAVSHGLPEHPSPLSSTQVLLPNKASGSTRDRLINRDSSMHTDLSLCQAKAIPCETCHVSRNLARGVSIRFQPTLTL